MKKGPHDQIGTLLHFTYPFGGQDDLCPIDTIFLSRFRSRSSDHPAQLVRRNPRGAPLSHQDVVWVIAAKRLRAGRSEPAAQAALFVLKQSLGGSYPHAHAIPTPRLGRLARRVLALVRMDVRDSIRQDLDRDLYAVLKRYFRRKVGLIQMQGVFDAALERIRQEAIQELKEDQGWRVESRALRDED